MNITTHQWPVREQKAVDDFYISLRSVWDTMRPWYTLAEPYSEAGAQQFRDAMRYGHDGWATPKRLDDVAVNLPIPSSSGNGDLYVRTFRPSGVCHGVYLHFHSGGWTLGSADIEDEVLSRIANKTGYMVASVEYRLAPKHRYPGAIEDGLDAAAFFLRAESEREYGPLCIVGGESAGAHLAMTVIFGLRQRGVDVQEQLRCLVFNYGVDLGLTPSVRNNQDNLILSRRDMEVFVQTWIQDRDPRDARVSPLYEKDFGNMPPAIFVVGDKDPLLDDSLFASMKWHAAGNETQVVIFPGSFHGLARLGGPDMEASLTVSERFIRAHGSA
ncbi:alpha/beta hydrolase fold-domain-containing protein [Aspergillus unguis]